MRKIVLATLLLVLTGVFAFLLISNPIVIEKVSIKKPLPKGTQCVTSGCSGEICAPKREEGNFGGFMTTCEWLPEYGCYKDCRLRNGQCSFDKNIANSCVSCIEECGENADNSCYEKCFQMK